MPSAISRPSEPVDTTSASTAFSRWPRRMIEPLPKARSICPRAASKALLRSIISLSTRRKLACDMALSLLLVQPTRTGNEGTLYRLCSGLQAKCSCFEHGNKSGRLRGDYQLASRAAPRSKNERWSPCPAETGRQSFDLSGVTRARRAFMRGPCGNGVIGARQVGRAQRAPTRHCESERCTPCPAEKSPIGGLARHLGRPSQDFESVRWSPCPAERWVVAT